jgi:hypothetical protein
VSGKRNYFKLRHKKTIKAATRIPTSAETIARQTKRLALRSDDDILSLAISQKQGDITVSQPEREDHFWVLGSTGEGKSKFLEYLIRKDIDRLLDEHKRGINPKEGYACCLCFIDPTPQGKVARLVFNYCAQIGFNKVLLIDPYLYKQHKKVVPINPLHYNERHITSSVDYLLDAFRVLFEVEDQSRTMLITTYLGALLNLFHYAGLTLSDLIYFTTPFDPDIPELVEQHAKRQHIYTLVEQKIADTPEHIKKILSKQLGDVKAAYKNILSFRSEAASTARRINQAVINPVLNLTFGHRKGVNFDKLISEGWVILVNASTGEGVGDLQSRLLATVVINEIIFTIEKLRRHGFNKPYYLYLDEASKYATDKLVDVLNTKRNIKLRLILSNQYPNQLKKRGILEAVQASAKTKIAFYIEDAGDRMDVVKMMYGGALPDREVSYALSSQEKREAVFKLNKREAVVAKTFDVPDAPFDKAFLENLLQSRNYATPDEIQKDYDERYPISKNTQSSSKDHTRPPGPVPKADGEAGSEAPPPKSAFKRGRPKGL